MITRQIPPEFQFRPNGQTKLPPHARMPSPVPIGVGTPMVESLPSYLSRLILHNYLVPSSFIFADVWPVLVKYFNVAPLHKQGPCPYFQNMGGSLAGAAGHAKFLAQVLYWLTWRPEITQLNAEGLEDVIDVSKAMMKHHRFCPQCLREAGTPYIPLLFHFRPVEVCPIHRVRLLSACLMCGHEQRSFSPALQASRCSNKDCGCDHLKPESWHPESATELQLAVAEAVGHLLVLKAHRSFKAEVLYENLHLLSRHWGSPQAFGREIGLDPTSVRSWVNRLRLGKKPARPQMETLVAVSHRTKILLPDLLSRKILKQELKEIPEEAPLTGWVHVEKRNRRPKFEDRMAHIPLKMNRYLESKGPFDPVSFAEFARSIGEDPTHLALVLKRDSELEKFFTRFQQQKTIHRLRIEKQSRANNIILMRAAIAEAERLGIRLSLNQMQHHRLKLPAIPLQESRKMIRDLLAEKKLRLISES